MKTSDFEIENGVLIKYKGYDKNVIIPGSVTNIDDNAFYDCSSLTEITIPDNVIRIGEWAFACCARLTSVTICDGVTDICTRAFWGCHKLTSIMIPDSVTSIGYRAFYNCNLNEIMFSKELALAVELNPENYEGLLDHKEKFKIK